VDELGSYRIFPLNAQVEVSDPNSRDYPAWGTGLEKAVATPDSIAIATIGDMDGNVTMRVLGVSTDVFPAKTPPGLEGLSHLHEGVLVLSQGDLVIGNGLAGDLHRLSVGPGAHKIRILGNAVARPSEVVILLGGVRRSDRK
jgi:hypothetical protein